VRALLASLFGLDGELAPLDSERDQNVYVRAAGGEYTLKIVNAAHKRKYTILMVGSGLAGASAAWVRSGIVCTCSMSHRKAGGIQ